MDRKVRQKDLIHKMDWNYFFLLDATRYDIFADTYDEFLDGDLTEAWSEGSNTLEWLARTWPGYYKIIYVSGIATVNSKGIWVEDGLKRKIKKVGGDEWDYIPSDHFERIIDVWDEGFMRSVNTVPPEPINNALRKLEDYRLIKYRPVIAHYVQPHFPWVRGPFWAEENGIVTDPFVIHENGVTKTLSPFSRRWVAKKFGDDVLEKAYRDNMRFVLDGIKDVVNELSGKVVITADHGWYLTGDRSHSAGSDDPELRTVPWFVIE